MHVSRGKARDSGKRRRPFDVSGPRFGVTGIDYVEIMQGIIGRIYGKEVQSAFMLPDVVPPRAKLYECNGFAKRKMTAPRFLGLSKQLVKALPLLHRPTGRGVRDILGQACASPAG